MNTDEMCVNQHWSQLHAVVDFPHNFVVKTPFVLRLSARSVTFQLIQFMAHHPSPTVLCELRPDSRHCHKIFAANWSISWLDVHTVGFYEGIKQCHSITLLSFPWNVCVLFMFYGHTTIRFGPSGLSLDRKKKLNFFISSSGRRVQ